MSRLSLSDIVAAQEARTDDEWVHIAVEHRAVCGTPTSNWHSFCPGQGTDWQPGMRFCPACGAEICPDCYVKAQP